MAGHRRRLRAWAARRGPGGARDGTQRAFRLGARPAGPLVIDIDATLITAHSNKDGTGGTYKGGFGFHPLLAYLEDCGLENLPFRDVDANAVWLELALTAQDILFYTQRSR